MLKVAVLTPMPKPRVRATTTRKFPTVTERPCGVPKVQERSHAGFTGYRRGTLAPTRRLFWETAESFEIPTISTRCENLGNTFGPVVLGYTPT